jgi:hypothetical protein
MIGSTRSLDGVDKLELWHDDTGIGNGWFADYVAVTDNKTSEEACFFIGQYLNKENGGINNRKIIDHVVNIGLMAMNRQFKKLEY